MSESFTDVVNVQISLAASPVSAQAFNVPLIAGESARFTANTLQTFTSLASMVSAGFLTSDPEYLAAATFFGQSPSPQTVAITQRGSREAQIETLTINTATNGHVYTATLDGYSAEYTASGGDTTTTIASAMVTALEAALPSTESAFFTIANASNNVVTITALFPGMPFTLAGADTLSTIATTQANHGIQEDLNAMVALGNAANWYGLMLANASDSTANKTADIMAAGTWVGSQTPKHAFIARFVSAGYLAGTDIAANYLFAKQPSRVAGVYTGTPNDYIDAGLWALFVTQTPGSYTPNLQSVADVATDNLNSTQIGFIRGVNGNYYTAINANGSFNAMLGGTSTAIGAMVCIDGNWFDNYFGADYLAGQMTISILNYLRSQNKVPYTDAGITAIASIIKQWLTTGVSNNLLTDNPQPAVTQTPASKVNATLKANRTVNSTVISFSAVLANAINTVYLNGTITT